MEYNFDIESSSYDCECCGWVDNASAVVTVGDRTFTIFHDGHFGAGVWDGEDSSIVLHVIGFLHGAGYIHIEDPHASWGVFTTDEDVPPGNQPIEMDQEFYANQKSISIELRKDDDNKFSFLVDGKQIFDHSVIEKLIPKEELDLYIKEGYMNDYEFMEVMCNHYVSDFEEIHK